MSKDPAFLFYSSDFYTGTATMTNEHIGMYVRLLCLQHQRGHLPEKDMLFICSTYVEEVFTKFLKDDKGLYYNVRLEIEANKRLMYSESRRKNIQKRYSKKGKKRATYVLHMENENEIENIIKDLNIILNTNYKVTTKIIRELINARIKDGFSVDDFKGVHRNMYKRWGTDPKMQEYLRPQTLYSNKFESYLNTKQGPAVRKSQSELDAEYAVIMAEDAARRKKEGVT